MNDRRDSRPWLPQADVATCPSVPLMPGVCRHLASATPEPSQDLARSRVNVERVKNWRRQHHTVLDCRPWNQAAWVRISALPVSSLEQVT